MLIALVFFPVAPQFDDCRKKAAALKFENKDIRKRIHIDQFAPTKSMAIQTPIAIAIRITAITVNMAAVPTIPRKMNAMCSKSNTGRTKLIK